MYWKVSKDHSWVKNKVNLGTLRSKQKAEVCIHVEGIRSFSFPALETGGYQMTKPGLAQVGEHNKKQNSGIVCLQKIHLKLKQTEKFKVTGYKNLSIDTNQNKLVA